VVAERGHPVGRRPDEPSDTTCWVMKVSNSGLYPPLLFSLPRLPPGGLNTLDSAKSRLEVCVASICISCDWEWLMIHRMPYLLRLRLMIHWLMLFPVMSVVCCVSCERLLANASPCNERLEPHCYAAGLCTWSNGELCEGYIPVRQVAVVLVVVGLTPPERNSPSVKDQRAPIPSIGSERATQKNTAAPIPICGLTTPKDVRPWNLPGCGVSRPLHWKMRQLFIFIQAQAEGILIPTWVTSPRKKTSSTLTSSALTLYHQSQFAVVCVYTFRAKGVHTTFHSVCSVPCILCALGVLSANT